MRSGIRSKGAMWLYRDTLKFFQSLQTLPTPPFCGRVALSPNNSSLIPVPKSVNEAKKKSTLV